MTARAPGRHTDGSAGDVDYGAIGEGYARLRQPDPRIAAIIHAALEGAGTVLNVGAGAGSYEPADRLVTALEPSATMRAQRPPHLAPAIAAVAEALPFAGNTFDASMATVTIHQWSDLERGLGEMRRVTRGPVVILTGDPDAFGEIWIADYCPEVRAIEARRFPSITRVVAALGGRCEIRPVPIPLDCTDGFNEAYYGRPERLLDPAARLACSSWSLVAPEVVDRFVRDLGRDLTEGVWDRRHGHLRAQPTLDRPLCLVVAHRA
jgi:SAM-dependent methyltransferase